MKNVAVQATFFLLESGILRAHERRKLHENKVDGVGVYPGS